MTGDAMRGYRQREIESLTPDYDFALLPDHLRGGIRDYIQQGRIPGDFLQAVITNDLSKAVGHADMTSMAHLDGIVKFMWNEAPGQCWGNNLKMQRWAKAGGLVGGAGPQPSQPTPLTFAEAESHLNGQDRAQVIETLRTWHPTVLAELLKAVTEARYVRYRSSHPDWTAAVREVAERAGFDLGPA